MTTLHERVTAGLFFTAVILALPTVAFAQVDPDPIETPVCTEQSVPFAVAVRCKGFSTVQRDTRLPDSVRAVARTTSGTPTTTPELTGTTTPVHATTTRAGSVVFFAVVAVIIAGGATLTWRARRPR